MARSEWTVPLYDKCLQNTPRPPVVEPESNPPELPPEPDSEESGSEEAMPG